MKILMVTPSWKILGGVSNHYMGMAPYWEEDVHYLFQGKRLHIPAIFTLIPDFIHFFFYLVFKRPDVVIVNPSLNWYQLLRDSIYVMLSFLLRIKVVTFIHGWRPEVANGLINNKFLMECFRKTFGSSVFIYVLYSQFKRTLDGFALKAPVLLTTTKVANHLVENFTIENRNGKIEHLLFLARLDFAKGIMTTLEAYNIMKSKYRNISISICGSGPALDAACQYVKEHHLSDVSFLGLVSGKQLIREYENADIYLLPTTHGEGMATSVLEAMAFGLPILTTGVGGVNDFFIDGKMGFLLNPKSPTDYAEKIEWYIEHPAMAKKCSLLNYQYAIEHFLASEVVKRFEKDIKCYIKR